MSAKQGDMRSASDVLMTVLDDFANSEGITVVVLHTNKDNEMCITTNGRKAEALGLCEYGKNSILRKIFEG